MNPFRIFVIVLGVFLAGQVDLLAGNYEIVNSSGEALGVVEVVLTDGSSRHIDVPGDGTYFVDIGSGSATAVLINGQSVSVGSTQLVTLSQGQTVEADAQVGLITVYDSQAAE